METSPSPFSMSTKMANQTPICDSTSSLELGEQQPRCSSPCQPPRTLHHVNGLWHIPKQTLWHRNSHLKESRHSPLTRRDHATRTSQSPGSTTQPTRTEGSAFNTVLHLSMQTLIRLALYMEVNYRQTKDLANSSESTGIPQDQPMHQPDQK